MFHKFKILTPAFAGILYFTLRLISYFLVAMSFMNKRIKIAFLLLILIQALHSVEEYIGRLWENYPPAQFLTTLVSDNHERGFIIINVCLFIFGMLVWLAAVQNYAFALVPISFLTIMEIINSVGHSVWAVMEKNYVPWFSNFTHSFYSCNLPRASAN